MSFSHRFLHTFLEHLSCTSFVHVIHSIFLRGRNGPMLFNYYQNCKKKSFNSSSKGFKGVWDNFLVYHFSTLSHACWALKNLLQCYIKLSCCHEMSWTYLIQFGWYYFIFNSWRFKLCFAESELNRQAHTKTTSHAVNSARVEISTRTRVTVLLGKDRRDRMKWRENFY